MQEDLKQIAAPLVAWYRENKRELPWRRDKNPYHVWISEIMLQQTRIEAVIEHYYAFMEALPDVASLAAVEEEKLLKLWEGLGYYSRARNLKKAAIKIMDEFGGEFPKTKKELLTLPGIGDYTAGAIASICFNEPVPAVDGNVLRVLARLRADARNVLLPETKKSAEALITEIIPADAGDFNEGIMELGETVCLPNGLPLCNQCPLCAYCKAYHKGLTDTLPVRIKTGGRKTEQKTVFLFTTLTGETAIHKRGDKGLLAGLFELPNTEGFLGEAQIKTFAAEQGLQVKNITFLKDTKHIFTHIEWKLKVYEVLVENTNNTYIWCTPAELRDTYALPTAFSKCIDNF
ncbi:MAG: A/G-specific adenine glycosylase [Clostridia bacterium]|nr:A/G-specific adenine glycosylase [Clostridia bacterium]